MFFKRLPWLAIETRGPTLSNDRNVFLYFHRNTVCQDIWAQFHQHSTYSFYACRSQKRQTTLLTWLSFCAFGICVRKSCMYNVDEIDTWCGKSLSKITSSSELIVIMFRLKYEIVSFFEEFPCNFQVASSCWTSSLSDSFSLSELWGEELDTSLLFLVSISSTFYIQLLRAQIPKE